MITKAQLKAQAKYDKENTKQLALKLNVSSDADILARLEAESNKQGYIKMLVRNDMRNQSEVLSVDSIKYLLLPIVKKYKIKSLSLFGSYARCEATPKSDVDILIDGGNYQGLIEYTGMVCEMKEALGRDVDVVTTASLKNSRTKADKAFRDNIEKDKVELL